jgi:hypothetical protein
MILNIMKKSSNNETMQSKSLGESLRRKKISGTLLLYMVVCLTRLNLTNQLYTILIMPSLILLNAQKLIMLSINYRVSQSRLNSQINNCNSTISALQLGSSFRNLKIDL